ncbi:MAG: MiaB/RimO family radical SAM methylthiotransferase [Lachnospiraceae bacterium]|nr:MiaB/RimO family radical SAM methylthiotransferase [Lachnospiraceae bacterium]
MKSVAFHNLGCKVNSYELDIMQQILQKEGYEIVPFDQIADIYIVNTCTVTNIADRKSRQMLHRAKQKNPDAVVVAVGCYVQTNADAAAKDSAIDLMIGNNRKKEIAVLLKEFLEQRAQSQKQVEPRKESKNPEYEKTMGGTSLIDIAADREYEEEILTRTAEHTRAYIKIQDGCNQFCSYCAIPLARGRVRSRHPEKVLEEIRGIVKVGYREIVLTGIHISSYGLDFDREKSLAEMISEKTGKEAAAENAAAGGLSEGTSDKPLDYKGQSRLIELVELIHDIPGLQRIRLSSMEPRIVTKEAAEKLASMKKVCPHFHLSLQSGCDATLKRMNRHYTAEQYACSVEELRNAYAPVLPAITTDVIVGFPGETEEEFAESREFLRKIGFYEMHIFKYSKRAGTRAAVMKDQVPEPVKAGRSDELIALERQQSAEFRRKYLGQSAQVLMEEEKVIGGKKYLIGHTTDYVRAALPVQSDNSSGPEGGRMHAPNDLVTLKLQDFLTEDILLGEEITVF